MRLEGSRDGESFDPRSLGSHSSLGMTSAPRLFRLARYDFVVAGSRRRSLPPGSISSPSAASRSPGRSRRCRRPAGRPGRPSDPPGCRRRASRPSIVTPRSCGPRECAELRAGERAVVDRHRLAVLHVDRVRRRERLARAAVAASGKIAASSASAAAANAVEPPAASTISVPPAFTNFSSSARCRVVELERARAGQVRELVPAELPVARLHRLDDSVDAVLVVQRRQPPPAARLGVPVAGVREARDLDLVATA